MYGGHSGTRRLPSPWGCQGWDAAPWEASPPPPAFLRPAAMHSFTGKSISMCPHTTHPWKETSKPLHSRDSRRGHTASTRPGVRTHTAEVSTLPLSQPQEKPRFPAKVPSWGTGTHLPTLREWLGSGVRFIIIILISSPGLTVAAAKENTKA